MSDWSKRTLMLAAMGVGALLIARAAVRREYDLRGRVVLITGGSRGLGLVMAREFAREGARIAICARNAAELERARLDLTERGAEVFSVPCDIAAKAQVDAMVHAVRQRFGRIDVLVNNAGVIQVGPLDTMTLADYEDAMKVHFWGPLYATLAILPEMQQRRDGRIVNITSIGGKVSVPHLLPYSASKFALVGFSEGLRAELAQDGIAVTTVCPGLMRTGSPRHATFKGQHQAEYAWFSISDALPLVSMNAGRAARQIVAACKRGDPEVVLSVQAKAVTTFHGLFPGLTAEVLGWINALLPGPDGIGTRGVPGKDSGSRVSPSIVTILNERAARRHNQLTREFAD